MTDAPKELTVDIDMDLLKVFYEAGGQAVGVSDLKQTLGLSLDEIATRVEALRAAGYIIGKSHPYGSTAFQMLEIPDRFYVHEIRRRTPHDGRLRLRRQRGPGHLPVPPPGADDRSGSGLGRTLINGFSLACGL